MKKLNISFAQTADPTGSLFSLMKCLSAVLYGSRYAAYADDVIAASGFAFRMWVAPGLCPSATSIWEFKKQKDWVENSGLRCGYIERLWGEDAVEQERRLSAVDMIKQSIDDGVAAVAWDISGCEWGVVTGYDDDAQTLFTLKINGSEDAISYEQLGKLTLPILSVLTVTGAQEKEPAAVLAGTKALAAAHLRGEEWGDNAKGLGAYAALIGFVRDKYTADTAWNLDYYLGTYAALKWYAWQFFEKYREPALAALYKTVYTAWKAAFDRKASGALSDEQVREEIPALLTTAYEAEQQALTILER